MLSTPVTVLPAVGALNQTSSEPEPGAGVAVCADAARGAPAANASATSALMRCALPGNLRICFVIGISLAFMECTTPRSVLHAACQQGVSSEIKRLAFRRSPRRDKAVAGPRQRLSRIRPSH